MVYPCPCCCPPFDCAHPDVSAAGVLLKLSGWYGGYVGLLGGAGMV